MPLKCQCFGTFCVLNDLETIIFPVMEFIDYFDKYKLMNFSLLKMQPFVTTDELKLSYIYKIR